MICQIQKKHKEQNYFTYGHQIIFNCNWHI